MARVLLAAATGADQSASIRVKSDMASLSAEGLTGAENADLQIYANAGWRDVYQGGSQVRLTPANTVISIEGPGLYRIDKEATELATSISAHLRRNADAMDAPVAPVPYFAEASAALTGQAFSLDKFINFNSGSVGLDGTTNKFTVP